MNDITLITIGSDRSLAIDNSAVTQRFRSYSVFFKKICAIVFSLNRHRVPDHVTYTKSVDVYFTNVTSRLFYIPQAFLLGRQLVRTLDLKKIVVSTQDPFESGLVGWLISKRYKVPLHVQVHVDMGSNEFQKASVLNKIRTYVARIVLTRAHTVRVVSPHIKKSIVDIYGVSDSHITVLPILNTYKPTGRIEGEEQYILIVGRLEKEKRIDMALRLCKKALDQNPELIIKIAGTGREEEKIKRMASELGIRDRVQFLGEVTDVSSLYAGARCLLHTSLYEGFGLVLYEAMMSGCPIVTTRVGIAEDLENKGYAIDVCNIYDQDALGEAVVESTRVFRHDIESVTLKYMPRSEEEYVSQYSQSIYDAVEN